MTAPSNPIFDRLTRDSKFSNLAQSIALPAGLAAAISLAVFYISPARSALSSFMVWVILFGPPLVGGLAALTAAQDSKSEAYTLLKLTPVPRSTIVWGYFWAGLYRARVVLAVLIGVFVPAFIVSLTVPRTLFTLSLSGECDIIVPPGQRPPFGQLRTGQELAGHCVRADDPRVLASKALGYLAYPGIILWVIPSAMLGMVVGLAGRSSVIAATASAVLLCVIALVVGLTLLGPDVSDIFPSCVGGCVYYHTWPPDPLPPLLYLGGSSLMTIGLASLASRFA